MNVKRLRQTYGAKISAMHTTEVCNPSLSVRAFQLLLHLASREVGQRKVRDWARRRMYKQQPRHRVLTGIGNATLASAFGCLMAVVKAWGMSVVKP
jgi:hypothetical protein